MLRQEVTDYGVKLAITKAQMDTTAAELEANRDKLRKVMAAEADERQRLADQQRELDRLAALDQTEQEQLANLKSRLERLDEKHKQATEEHMQCVRTLPHRSLCNMHSSLACLGTMSHLFAP
jgi:chromosome segregation ATPase